jgi:hypothetical protein
LHGPDSPESAQVNGHTAWDSLVAAQPLPDLAALVSDVPLPLLTPVRRAAVSTPLADVEAAARREVAAVLAASARAPGPVAVTAGSRGIANVVIILRAVVAELRAAGWEPFIVPAMGSHGGGTEAGQLAVLEELGVTEQAVGATLRATMAVDELGATGGAAPSDGAGADSGAVAGGGARVYIDRFAAQAGAVFVVGRVKAHTDFHGPLESGPTKMLAVGLGHRASAAELHAAGPAGLRAGIGEAARLIVSRGLVVGALAVVENEIGQTAHVQGLRPDEIAGEPEERLLDMAKAMMPRLPFAELDVLVVQRLGKEISGEGVDPNVIGRLYITGEPEPESPRIGCIVALSLTEASSGNGLGIGLVDFVSARLAQALDFGAIYTNALTAGLVDVQRAKLPIVLDSDRLAMQAALASCGRRDPAGARLLWIEDTEHLDVVGASAPLAAEARERDDLVVGSEPPAGVAAAHDQRSASADDHGATADDADGVEMRFDGRGSLLPLWPTAKAR